MKVDQNYRLYMKLNKRLEKRFREVPFWPAHSFCTVHPEATSALKTLLPYLDRSCDAPATTNVLALKNTSISFIEDGDFRWVSAFIRMSEEFW